MLGQQVVLRGDGVIDGVRREQDVGERVLHSTHGDVLLVIPLELALARSM